MVYRINTVATRGRKENMPINKYEQIKNDLFHLVVDGGMHSTIVGKTVTLGGSEKSNARSAEELSEYIIGLIKKAETYRKDSVKKTKN